MSSIEVRGEKYPIELEMGWDKPRMVAIVGGERVVADTMDQMRARITVLQKKNEVKVSIPFTVRSGNKFYDGFAYGISKRDHEPLVRLDGGKPSDLDRYATFYEPMGYLEQEEGKALKKASDAAEKAWRDWENAHRMDAYGKKDRKSLKARVEEAIQREIDKQN